MKSQTQKDIIVFVPHYIGSFKYYEKLVPYLQERYEVLFLILFVHEKYFTEMKKYALKGGHQTFIVEPPANGIFDWIAPIRYARNINAFRAGVRKLFYNGSRIRKIISVNDSGIYIRHLFNEAHKIGIETVILQWAMSFEGNRDRRKKQARGFRGFLYVFGKPLYAKLKRLIARLILGHGFIMAKALSGHGNSDKFGVINRQAYDYFARNGVPEEKLSIVGYLDYHFAEKVKNNFDQNEKEREAAAQRLSINTRRKRIVFFSSPYNGKDIKILTNEEQYNFTEALVKTIRAVFPAETHDIYLKIHPSENIELYQPLTKWGVKLYDKHTDNYELIYFADLYIAGGTGANFIPLVMGKDAIFVNFLKLSLIESIKKVFNLKNFVTDYQTFTELLIDFKNGALPKQYYDVDGVTTPDSLKKILEWIG